MALFRAAKKLLRDKSFFFQWLKQKMGTGKIKIELKKSKRRRLNAE